MSSNQPPAGDQPPPGQQPGGMWGAPPPNQPPAQPPGPYSGGQPEWLGSGGPPPGATGGGSRRGLLVGAAAAAMTLVVGGGAFAAYQLLSGGGAQPAEALPGSAIAYTRIDIDPSAEQKIATLRLLRRVPQFEQETGITSDKEDLRRLLVEKALGDSECSELSYDEDFAPWVGDRAGFAIVPVDGEIQPVLAIQVTDQGKAQDAVAALSSCSSLASAGDDTTGLGAGESGDESGIEFVNDYMLIAQTKDLAADFAAEAESSPLSDNAGFSDAMDQLGDQGLASFWADIDAVRELPAFSSGELAPLVGPTLGGIHSYSGAFRAGSDYLELSFSIDSDTTLPDEQDNPVGDLPDTTLGAVSISNGADYVDTYWDQLKGYVDAMEPGAFDQSVAEFEAESGLVLPDDLRTILGDNVTAAVDAEGLTPDNVSSPADFANAGFGFRFVTDPEAIADVVSRLQAKIDASGTPFTIVSQQTDDGLVVASNQEYAATLADGGALGDSDAFQTAVPDASDAEAVLYVDLDKVRDVAAAYGESDTSVIDRMRAFGITLHQGDDGYATATMRLTFD